MVPCKIQDGSRVTKHWAPSDSWVLKHSIGGLSSAWEVFFLKGDCHAGREIDVIRPSLGLTYCDQVGIFVLIYFFLISVFRSPSQQELVKKNPLMSAIGLVFKWEDPFVQEV